MLILEIIAILAGWFLLLVIKLVKARKIALELLLFLGAIGLYVVSVVLEIYVVDKAILTWTVYGGFLISLFFFDASILWLRSPKVNAIKQLRKEHRNVVMGYESLRKRFIATIDLLRDGLAFRSNDGNMFGTDKFIRMIGFENNEFSQASFDKLIHPDDITGYKAAIAKLKKKQPNYEMSYRFKKGNQYIWLKEKGTMIFYDDHTMVISMTKSIDTLRYPETEVEYLNKMKLDHAFLEYLQSLNRLKVPYYVVLLELSNIPAMNEKYGRDIGDLMMGEFINKLRFNFVKDEHSIFRLTGIRFAMVMKDERKFKILERALKHGGDLLNFDMKFGNVHESVYPHFGIQKITMFEEPLDDVINRNKKALEIAISNDTHENYFMIG